MLGYLGGMATAVVVVNFAIQAWPGGEAFPRLLLGGLMMRTLISTIACWIIALVPFLALYCSTGRRAFADPDSTVLSGVIVMFITAPIFLWLGHVVTIDGPPYSWLLADFFGRYWLALIVAGGAFGLVYWAIERRLSLQ